MKSQALSDNSQLKTGVILSYVKIFATIIISLLYTPFLLRMLGQVEYGLFSLAFSFIGAFAFLDLGMGSANVRFTASLIAEGNRTRENQLHGMFLILYSGLGFIALIIGALLYLNLESFFGKSMSVEELEKLKLLLFIVVPYVALNLPLSIFAYIVRAYERFVFERLLRLVQTILNPLIVIGLLLLGFKIIGVVSGIALLNILVSFCIMVYAITVLKIKFILKKFDKKLLYEIVGFSALSMLGVISYRVDDSGGQLILGSVAGTVDVAVYALAYMLFFNFRLISQAINSLMLSVLAKIPNDQNQMKVFNHYFISIGRIQFFVLTLFVLGFIFFGKPFIWLWAGSNYNLTYYIALLLILSAFFNMTQSVAKTILSAQFKHQFVSALAIALSIVNLGGAYLLATLYGPVGVAYSFSVMSILLLITLNVYYAKYQQFNVSDFWLQIARTLPSMILPMAFGIFYLYRFDTYSWASLSIGIIAFFLLYSLSVFFIGLNASEKKLIINPIKSLHFKFLG